MELNLKNIEELVFFDKKIQTLLPEFKNLFDQWQLGQRIPGVKSLAQKSVFDLLNSLNESHLKILKNYFNDDIIINKLDNKLVSNYKWNVEESPELCKYIGYRDFCVTRNKDKISISFWR